MISVTISAPIEFADLLLDGAKHLIHRLGTNAVVRVENNLPTAVPEQPTIDFVAERVARVRNRCSTDLWSRVQAIANVVEVDEPFTLADAAKRTGIPFGKVRSDWNVLGRPFKSEPGPDIFRYVPGSTPKAFTLGQEARAAILKP